MKIGILTADSNGCFPVPATKGGAVSTLVESLIKENSEKGLCNFTIFSYYDEDAYKKSKNYNNVNFVWVKVPKYIKRLDNVFFNSMNKIGIAKAISYKSIFSLIYYIKFVASYLRRYKFDNLILENNIPLIWAIRLSKYTGKYYYHFHNVPRISAGSKKAFTQCAGFLCVSKYVAHQIESAESAIGPINSEKVKVLYNAVDTKLFRPYDISKLQVVKNKIRKLYDINVNQKIILYTGRLSKEKGVDVLLDAISSLDRHDYKLLIVGSVMHGSNREDDYLAQIKDKANKMENNIVFTNYISHSVLPDYYNAADIVILPSIWEEPAGLTMVEALACGAVVITTESGGIPEYVGDDAVVIKNNTLLVNNLTYETKKILEKINCCRKRNSKRIKKIFSEDSYLERFLKCIKN